MIFIFYQLLTYPRVFQLGEGSKTRGCDELVEITLDGYRLLYFLLD